MKPITEPSSSAAFARNGEPSIAARVLLASLRVYKLLFSQYFTGSCRFLPSCADYAVEAVTRHGAWRGTWLAARRLSRCHPMCAAGHDPVPQ